jgi:FkbM family methyltransferase
MLNLSVLKRTLTVTKNPLDPFYLRYSKERRRITFRNGFTFKLTWHQFRIMRDIYPQMQKYTITQEEDDLFRINDNKSEVACSSLMMPLMCDLMQKYAIRQLEKDLFNIKDRKIELIGSACMLGCIQEQETGEYDYDYQNKVVLDVGGFQGESSVFFSARGAKKVIIYEPVTSHIELIRRNVAINNVNAEIHNKGIGDRDVTLAQSYTEIDTSFGLSTTGLKKMEIKLKNVAKAIEESHADVAKFDCEGAEMCLVGVPTEILRKIEFYIIEVHSPEIRGAILEKFWDAGFVLEKETPKTLQLSVLALRRNKLP